MRLPPDTFLIPSNLFSILSGHSIFFMAHLHSPFCGCSWITKYINKENDQVNLQRNHIVLWLDNLSDTPALPDTTASHFGRKLDKMNSEGCSSTSSQYSAVFQPPQLGFPLHATVDVPMVDSHTFGFLSMDSEVDFPMTTTESDPDMSSSIAEPTDSTFHRSSKRTSRPRQICSMLRGRRPNSAFFVDYEKKKALRRLFKEEAPNPPRAKPAAHHNSTCGCSPTSVTRKNREILRLGGILQHAASWGDLESPSDKVYDFGRPELPPRQPKHRTRTPFKSCLKRAPRVRFCDDLYSGESDSDYSSLSSDDDSDTDSICHSFDGDNASRTGKVPRFIGREKEVKGVRFGKARCLRTGQSMPPTPRTPQNDSRVERSRARQVVENKYHKMLTHKGDEGTKMEQVPSLAFIWQDAIVEQRLQRAADIAMANERAAIGRGALDFLIFVCRDRDSTGNQISEHMIDRLVKHRGNLPIVASYHGEEREYANPGRSNVSPVPAHLYRDCQSSMSWVRTDEVDEMDTSL